MMTIEFLAVTVATAAGIWRAGTTDRSAPACAAEKSADAAPSTNATTGICQKTASPARIVAARLPIARTRTASAAIISALRFQRSAAAPASRPKSAYGTTRAKPTIPAFAGEWVSASTSSG